MKMTNLILLLAFMVAINVSFDRSEGLSVKSPDGYNVASTVVNTNVVDIKIAPVADLAFSGVFKTPYVIKPIGFDASNGLSGMTALYPGEDRAPPLVDFTLLTNKVLELSETATAHKSYLLGTSGGLEYAQALNDNPDTFRHQEFG